MNEHLNRFRVAGRELFNNYFRVDSPYENGGWELLEQYETVEKALFNALVKYQVDLNLNDYGETNANIVVAPTSSTRTPIMVNREKDCGYWDYPVEYAPPEARFAFINFFDWDKLDFKDNRYVLVEIADWPEHQELVGKQALIETQYVKYENA